MNKMHNNKKVKVGLITLHSQYNFGAALQAYSLQEAINELGGECLLLNYFFEDDMKKYSIRPNATLKGKILDFFILPKSLIQHKAYHLFHRRFYNNITRLTKDWEELSSLSKECEVLVCGSDQIWNPALGDIFSPYFLKFALPYQRKVSYAPSVNSNQIDTELIPVYRELLSDFHSVSVREEATANHLTEIINQPVSCTLDPALLHNQAFFDNMLSRYDSVTFPDKFIFVYSLHLSKRKKLFTFAEDYARKHNVKIVYFSKIDSIGRLYSKNIFTNDPLAFLKAIKEAEFVVGDSFHACALSVIYHKQFVYGLNSIRINDLVQKLGIKNRMISNSLDIDTEIDYNDVENKLAILREKSIAFLERAILGTEENENGNT